MHGVGTPRGYVLGRSGQGTGRISVYSSGNPARDRRKPEINRSEWSVFDEGQRKRHIAKSIGTRKSLSFSLSLSLTPSLAALCFGLGLSGCWMKCKVRDIIPTRVRWVVNEEVWWMSRDKTGQPPRNTEDCVGNSLAHYHSDESCHAESSGMKFELDFV
ncbi:unnamed protein product [Periconia digitata]|uniref:Uncharacterized protein n=1 Tax=Periconia digitata TaxID=1303443 RepID=A0A9W4URV7_9PLEO|nr:unnamed protein product [Periconia digitata]